MTTLTQAPPAPASAGVPPSASRSAVPQISWNWLGVIPFFLFVFAFLVLPSSRLITDSFQDSKGAFTLQNFADLFRDPLIILAFRNSIEIGVATSLIGGLFGFLVAYAITLGHTPGWMRSGLLTFSGIAANFGGVPLAFAFIATVGRTGFLTAVLTGLGFNIYDHGFSLYTFWGLLFGSAFGAFATAQALTGGTLILASLLIGTEIRGDTLGNANLGYALAVGMVVVMAVTIGLYAILQRRSSRWLR